MRIIRLVTIRTLTRGIAIWFFWRVTARASERFMSSFQWEGSLSVEKGIEIERSNVGISAEMVGVACFAVRVGSARRVAVETPQKFEVITDGFMTFEAKRALFHFLEAGQ